MVLAVASRYPSGDRASAVQIVFWSLQLHQTTQTPMIMSRVVLGIGERRTLRIEDFASDMTTGGWYHTDSSLLSSLTRADASQLNNGCSKCGNGDAGLRVASMYDE